MLHLEERYVNMSVKSRSIDGHTYRVFELAPLRHTKCGAGLQILALPYNMQSARKYAELQVVKVGFNGL
jgi:hypothetical protein